MLNKNINTIFQEQNVKLQWETPNFIEDNVNVTLAGVSPHPVFEDVTYFPTFGTPPS